jgi:hypothetical protein
MELYSGDGKAMRGSDPRKAGRRTPVRMALRAGMSAKKNTQAFSSVTRLKPWVISTAASSGLTSRTRSAPTM